MDDHFTIYRNIYLDDNNSKFFFEYVPCFNKFDNTMPIDLIRAWERYVKSTKDFENMLEKYFGRKDK